MKRSYRWHYRWPGCFHSRGPTTETFSTERQARAHLRELYSLKRLPIGTEVYPDYLTGERS